MSPIQVYLDSSDYSVLSDRKRRETEAPGVLDALRSWTRAGDVQCLFSGVHLSEMAPTHARHAAHAESRADLLVELCGRNAWISFDRLFKGEFEYAWGRRDVRPSVFSATGDWFPDIGDISPVTALEHARSVRLALADTNLSREQRRKAQRMANRRGKARDALQAAALENARTGPLDELLRVYPMRPDAARVLARFVFGDATVADATNAFLESLRDPRWMMKWFYDHHDRLTPFIGWVRDPASNMHKAVIEMAQRAAEMRETDAKWSTSLADDWLSSPQWLKWQDRLVASVAHRAAAHLLEDRTLTEMPVDEVDQRCPGFSTAIRTLHSAWRTSTLARPRAPKASDLPDGLHAAYVPYVDVFRADAFMAPHLHQRASLYGTVVVPKLTDLVPAITLMLERR
jgi:hypothetical protein